MEDTVSEMTTPQILRAAATHIATYGWEKGRLHGAPKTIQRLVPPTLGPVEWAGAAGMQPVQTITETTVDYSSACTLGALEIVSGVRNAAKDVPPRQTEAFRAYTAAVVALEDHLIARYHHRISIPSWNDSVAQDIDEVVAMLNAVADKIEAQQAQMAEMTKSIQAANEAMVRMVSATPAAAEALLKVIGVVGQIDEADSEPTPEADAVAALNEAAAVIEAAQSEAVSA